MSKNPIIEVCSDSLEVALAAQSAGAARVELCVNLAEDGTTPPLEMIDAARKLLNLQLFVLIRPRGGDFCYSDEEFECIKSDIHRCGKIGCDGVVIGILNQDGTIDVKRCRELVEIARQYSLKVTFHRAFDRCADLFQGLEKVIELGCERILTSGGKNSAIEGAATLSQLIKQAENRIIIMPGAGINPENITKLIEITGASEIHGTFRNKIPQIMAVVSN